MKDVKKIAASRRKKILIIVSVAVIILLAVAIAYVLDYVRTTVYEDPADDAKYYIRLVDGEYKMFGRDKKTELERTDDNEYYITEAGTLVRLIADTGEYFTMAVVDENYSEVSVDSNSILALPYRKTEEIRSIEVHNEHGSFTLHRFDYVNNRIDDTADFSLKGFPFVSVDPVGLASVSVATGRLLTTRKLVSPDALTDEQKENIEDYEHLTYITNEDGTLDEDEYGFMPEKREKLDEETGETVEYDYEPAYFIVTSIADENGKTSKYKVIVGDRLVTGDGYYIQIVEYKNGKEEKRDVVYIATQSMGVSVLERAEKFATATLSYPMTMTTYLDVKNFHLFEKGKDDPEVAFSFIPLDDREDTAYSGNAYKFHGTLEGYAPATTVIAECLEGIYQPAIVGVKKLIANSEGPAPLVEFGFYREVKDKDGKTEYEMNYDYMVVFDYKTEEYGVIRQTIMIVKAENGNYYAYTTVHDPENNEMLFSYNMVVEVSAYSFHFLTMESHHWVESRFFNTGITFVDRIKLDSPDYTAEFVLDNSKSDSEEPLDSSKLIVLGVEKNADGETNTITTFRPMYFRDKNDIIWQITETEVKVYKATGEETTISENSWYETRNLLGQKVRALNGVIECYDSSGAEKIVKVHADEVIVKDVKTGKEGTYIRSGTSQFRLLYQSFLRNQIENSYEMSAEEEKALIENKDNWLLTLTVRIDGEDVEYSFYYLSPRKAYLTVNGNGGFYVHLNRAEKNITDAQNFFDGVVVNPSASR